MVRHASNSAVRQAADRPSLDATTQAEHAGVPALAATADGEILFANQMAAALTQDGELKPVVKALIVDTAASRRPQLVRLTLPGADGPQRFDVTLLPEEGGGVLLLARDSSIEANLISALTESRELFRDLALCSADFAFETDATGVFSWVSPRGMLGWSAGDLHGSRPTDVFGSMQGVDCFNTKEPLSDAEIWIKTKDGKSHCFIVNALPAKDHKGVWRGTRGIARDVTVLRQQERDMARFRRREALASRIIEAMRAEIDPVRMLDTAARALRDATQACSVSIRCVGSNTATVAGTPMENPAHRLDARTLYRGDYNGTIGLTRGPDGERFGEEERLLLGAVVPQIGVAIALCETLKALADQSSRDVLTGLNNRRGFWEEVNRRLSVLQGNRRHGALIVTGCDNFKAINDAKGHAGGDDVLRAIAQLLPMDVPGEVSARLNGDEFAIFIDDVDEARARARAEALRRGFGQVRREMNAQVTASVGIAMLTPQVRETLDTLVARAEVALRDAKRQGGDRVVLSDDQLGAVTC